MFFIITPSLKRGRFLFRFGRKWSLLIFSLFFTCNLHSQPRDVDYVLSYGGTGIYLASEYVIQIAAAESQPQWTEPPAFDVFFREQMLWGNSQQAANLSDILLFGLFVPSAFITPALSEHKFARHLALNLQVFAANGLLTNLTKYITHRQRPYARFNPEGRKKSPDDNLSFFSGHTSFSFAAAIVSSLIFEKEHPETSGLVWSASISLATATALLRIAADKHYMTDVLAGALIGSLSAYVITKNQHKRFFRSAKNQNMQFSISIPLNWISP